MALTKLADEIIELDKLNMKAHFIASGSGFNPEYRRAGLEQEIHEGAEILEVRRNGKLVAYLEYLPPHNGEFRIPSLQVHPDFHGTSILRSLLAQAAQRIVSWPDATLRTRVHPSNVKSIRLHARLGFSHVGSVEGRFLFEGSVSVFRVALQTYLPRTKQALLRAREP